MTGIYARAGAGLVFALLCWRALGETPQLLHRYIDVAPSPDGVYVADVEGDAPVSGREPTVRDLIIRRVDTGATIIVSLPCGRVRECWPSSLAWTPHTHQLSFALRRPGTHARSIYRVEADDGHLTQLLAFDGTITSLQYSRDGQLAMLATASADKEVGATQAGASLAEVQNAAVHEQRIGILRDQQLEWASPADLYVYEYDWLPDSLGFVGTAAPGDGDSNWWIAKLYRFEAATTLARVLYAPADPRQQIAEPRVTGDGRSVAFIGGLMSDFGSTGGDVFLVPIAGGPASDATRGQHASATSLGIDCQGHLLAKLLRGDQSEIVQLNPVAPTSAPLSLWSGSGAIFGHEAGVSLGCPSGLSATVQEDFAVPPEIQVGAIAHWRAFTNLNAGMTGAVQARSIHWKNGGYTLQGWLLLPTDDGHKSPMITVVHGGPAAASTPSYVGPGILRALLEKGYALFLPNPRGSFGQGEAFTAANVRDFGHGDLRDILTGIDAAIRAAPVDDSRLGIMGGSYGGYFTMWTVTQTHRFKAAVAQAGISDWLSYYGENGIDQWLLPYFGASVYADPGVYARSSPINYIRNVRTPTLEYVGENDIECPAPQTQEFWHALQELGVPTTMVIYPQEGHGLRDPAHLEDAQKRVLDWFNHYLQPSHGLTGRLQ
jgi:dienelactone hydrolase